MYIYIYISVCVLCVYRCRHSYLSSTRFFQATSPGCHWRRSSPASVPLDPRRPYSQPPWQPWHPAPCPAVNGEPWDLWIPWRNWRNSWSTSKNRDPRCYHLPTFNILKYHESWIFWIPEKSAAIPCMASHPSLLLQPFPSGHGRRCALRASASARAARIARAAAAAVAERPRDARRHLIVAAQLGHQDPQPGDRSWAGFRGISRWFKQLT